MTVTAYYNQASTNSDNWIGTFQVAGVYYAIKDPNQLYRIETNGTATYLRTVWGNNWGAVKCDGTYIYRTSGSYVGKVDISSGSLSSSAYVNSTVKAVGLDIANGIVYSLSDNGNIYKITTSNMSASYLGNVGSGNYGRAMAFLNGVLYIPVYGGQIKKYVVATNTLSILATSTVPAWLCLETDGTYIYGSTDGGRIYQLDPSDVLPQEEVTGDTTGRFWYSLSIYNGTLFVAPYSGPCFKAVPITPIIQSGMISGGTINNDTTYGFTDTLADGEVIKYTIDGTLPTSTNGITYTGTFTLTKSCTVRAIKFFRLWSSPEYTSTFSYVCLAATSSQASGTYDASIQVAITSTSSSAQIYYTLDGTDPTTSSTLYTGPFWINTMVTLKTIAIKNGCTSSAITTYSYFRDSAYYYLMPQTSGIVYTGLAITPSGYLFGSASADAVIWMMDANTGARTYWGTSDSGTIKLYAYNSLLFYLGSGLPISAWTVNAGGIKGTLRSNFALIGTWKSVVMTTGLVTYGLKDGYVWKSLSDSTQGANVVKLTSTYYGFEDMTLHNGKLYACGLTGIYEVSMSTGNVTQIISTINMNWKSLCSDGKYMYICSYGGYIYRIDITAGTYNRILGDDTERLWSNVRYYQGVLYATVATGGVYRIGLTGSILKRSAVYSGGWKDVNNAWVFSGGTWKPAIKTYRGINGVWTRIL